MCYFGSDMDVLTYNCDWKSLFLLFWCHFLLIFHFLLSAAFLASTTCLPVGIDPDPLGVLTVPGVNGLMGSVLEKV